MNGPSQVHAKFSGIISRMAQEPKAMLELPALYYKMLELLRDEAGYQNSALLLIDSDGYLAEVAVSGYRSKGERRKYPLPFVCLEDGHLSENVFLINNVETIPPAKQGSSIGKGSLLVVLMMATPPPIIFNHDDNGAKITGALLLEDEHINAFSDTDCQLIQLITPHFATMIELARHYQKVRDMAMYDELTGLHNRRFFLEYLDTELKRSARNNQSFSLVIIDLDSLKRINDVYGHLIGDTALKTVAQVLSRNVRSYDILARYAGDEFVLAMPDTGLSEAERVVNRLVTANDQARLEHLSQSVFLPSYSYGLATFPQDGRTYEEMFASADKRLYEAKARKGIATEEIELAER